ncbi:NAD(P)H-binding protein [Oceanobacillus sp. CFH 90083]|uniref:NAD(P)H-binding protein n=1 Tax=Oceanobacillus sp. CFH 90083 TaxID=2592336 RepID=UPI00128D3086|nr:NAD(P)H-binding protein [Oceanobacillus sp. CFH 90083]
MTILVTGATGTVGRHIVDQLVNKGEQVRAVSRNPENANLPKGVEVVAGDLMSPETLMPAFQGVTALYLITSSDQAEATLETNPQVADLAEKAGVQKVSLLTVYGDGPVEQAIKNSRLEWTFVQPVGFMANAIDDWQESIREAGVVRKLGGEKRGAVIHEADIAAVFVETLLENGHHGNFYTLTGPEALSTIEQVEMISKAIGKEIKFEELSEEEARNDWRKLGHKEESIDFMVQMSKNPPEIGYTVLPTVEEVIGRPAKTFAEWVSEHKSYFM